jgi:hypothetical protein
VVRFNLRKMSDLEIREHYLIKIPIRFASLESLNDKEVTNRILKTLKRILTRQLK